METGVGFYAGVGIFPATNCRQILWHTQPPIQWVPGGGSGRGVKLFIPIHYRIWRWSDSTHTCPGVKSLHS